MRNEKGQFLKGHKELLGKKMSIAVREMRRKMQIGKKLSEETKRKMSISAKGRIRSAEHCKHISESKKGEKNWMFGKHFSEEMKRKQRIRLKGVKKHPLSEETKRKISESKKGIIAGMFGLKHSKETKEKISKATKGRSWSEKRRSRGNKKHSYETRKKMSESSHKGKENSQWRGGVTPIHCRIRHSMQYHLWRESVFKRDNYTCVQCGDNKGGNLNADHIKPFAFYPELRFAIDNGRTLCLECHKKTDTYGRKAKKLYEKKRG